MALAGVEYAGSLFFSFVCGTWDRTGNARDILFLCDTLIVLFGEFLARKTPFTVIGCEWNTCACLLSTVLHSGQWLNKPRRKAEKGRGKLAGGRGVVHWKCIAKWKQSRKDIARKRTACVDNDQKKITYCKKQGRKSTFQELQGNSNGLYVRIKAICKLSTAY